MGNVRQQPVQEGNRSDRPKAMLRLEEYRIVGPALTSRMYRVSIPALYFHVLRIYDFFPIMFCRF